MLRPQERGSRARAVQGSAPCARRHHCRADLDDVHRSHPGRAQGSKVRALAVTGASGPQTPHVTTRGARLRIQGDAWQAIACPRELRGHHDRLTRKPPGRSSCRTVERLAHKAGTRSGQHARRVLQTIREESRWCESHPRRQKTAREQKAKKSHAARRSCRSSAPAPWLPLRRAVLSLLRSRRSTEESSMTRRSSLMRGNAHARRRDAVLTRSVRRGFPTRPTGYNHLLLRRASSDTIASIIGRRWPRSPAQIVLDNRAGGNGAVGTHSREGLPDGHTIGLAYIADVAPNPAIWRCRLRPVKISRRSAAQPPRERRRRAFVDGVSRSRSSAPPPRRSRAAQLPAGGVGKIGQLSAELLQPPPESSSSLPYKGRGQRVLISSGPGALMIAAVCSWSTRRPAGEADRRTEKSACRSRRRPRARIRLSGFDARLVRHVARPHACGHRQAVNAIRQGGRDPECATGTDRDRLRRSDTTPDAFARYIQSELVEKGRSREGDGDQPGEVMRRMTGALRGTESQKKTLVGAIDSNQRPPPCQVVL